MSGFVSSLPRYNVDGREEFVIMGVSGVGLLSRLSEFVVLNLEV